MCIVAPALSNNSYAWPLCIINEYASKLTNSSPIIYAKTHIVYLRRVQRPVRQFNEKTHQDLCSTKKTWSVWPLNCIKSVFHRTFCEFDFLRPSSNRGSRFEYEKYLLISKSWSNYEFISECLIQREHQKNLWNFPWNSTAMFWGTWSHTDTKLLSLSMI